VMLGSAIPELPQGLIILDILELRHSEKSDYLVPVERAFTRPVAKSRPFVPSSPGLELTHKELLLHTTQTQ
jgi:hypothetical protein